MKRTSADAFPQLRFLVQPINFHSLEIAARDDAPDPSVLDDWKMTKAAIIHRPQRVDCPYLGWMKGSLGWSRQWQ